jgi:hypothetical protein
LTPCRTRLLRVYRPDRSSAPPHQTGLAVFPHPAFRCSSHQSIRRVPTSFPGNLVQPAAFIEIGNKWGQRKIRYWNKWGQGINGVSVKLDIAFTSPRLLPSSKGIDFLSVNKSISLLVRPLPVSGQAASSVPTAGIHGRCRPWKNGPPGGWDIYPLSHLRARISSTKRYKIVQVGNPI